MINDRTSIELLEIVIHGNSLPDSADVELELNDVTTAAGHVEEEKVFWLTSISEPNPHYSTQCVEITEEINMVSFREEKGLQSLSLDQTTNSLKLMGEFHGIKKSG